LNKLTVPWLACITILLVILLLASCTYEAVEVQQEQATGLAGELLDGGSFGQTFIPRYDGLSRIDLYTATYARENTRPVIFQISLSPDGEGGRELLHLELPADRISNSGPTVITFPPIADTAGETLYFSIASPGSVPGDAITIYYQEGDVYPGGEMFVDGEPTEGDLAFIVYTEESFTLVDVWDDFYSRASQDRLFFIFYCSLMAILLISLFVFLVWSARKRRAGEPGSSGDSDSTGAE